MVGCSAVAVDASGAVVVADGLQARVEGSLLVLNLRLSPPGLADDVAQAVADVPAVSVTRKLIKISPNFWKKVAKKPK